VLSTNIFRPALGQPLQVSFKAQHAGRCWITIYNLAGENVRPLFEDDVQADLWLRADWDGKNGQGEAVGSGVYFVSVKGAGVKVIRKVVVLK